VTVTRRIPEKPGPGRLGRHVRHDPASRAFAVEAAPTSTLVSVVHKRRVPPYDQGNLGSCVGNATAGILSTAPFRHSFHERTAVRIYSAATKLDAYPGDYPPDDTGTDGLAGAAVAKAKGWCSAYLHAFSLEAALTALQTSAVMVGMAWLTGCDKPDGTGLIRYTGTVRGGHEICADSINVKDRLVGFTNSWGTSFGAAGRFYMTWDDLGLALADQGDVTQLVP